MKSPFVEVDTNTQTLLYAARTELCFGCDGCAPSLDTPANMAHVSFQLAKKTMPFLTTGMLCRIAWFLQPVVPWSDLRHLSDHRPSLRILPRSGILYTTSLGRLIQRVTQLSLELERMIRDLLPPSLFTSLANSIETLDWLQSNTKTWKNPKHRPKPVSYSLPELPSSSSSILGVNMISILGERCLKHVGLGTEGTFDLELLLPAEPIQGVQFALGTYGVIALRVLYEDGSDSSWVGQQTPQKWFRSIKTSELSKLRVYADVRITLASKHSSPSYNADIGYNKGLKLLSMDVSPSAKETYGLQTTRIIWDRDMGPQGSTCFSLAEKSDLVRHPRIRGNPNTRYGLYLPLNLGGPVKSLTVFCTVVGISCIHINGDVKARLWKPSDLSCSLTHHFGPGETIENLYAVTRGPKDPFIAQGPYLLATTSSGRCLYYGPYNSNYHTKLQTHLSALSPQGDDHDLLGIFTDSITINPYAYRTLGVVRQPRNSESGRKSKSTIQLSIPTTRHYDPSSLAAHSFNCTFVNKASFSGVKYLQVQRVGPRCVGILIASDDGSLSTLGQSDPSQSDEIYPLYQDSEGPLKSITFVYSSTEETVEKFVQEILVNEDESDSIERHRFACNNPNTEIAWWFTYAWDQIMTWDGYDMVKDDVGALPFSTVA